MPACVNETVAPVWPSTHHRTGLFFDRARAGSSSSSSCSSSGSESGSPRPGSPAEWIPSPEPKSFINQYFGWYPALVLKLVRQMLSLALFLAWSNIILSTGLWILDCILKIPLDISKWILSAIYGSRGLGRTVLITGSSIETLQIARNFYKSGARVIVLEHDDRFGLVRFSTAVEKFYKVPVPQQHPQEYVREICRIAERENASYFIPTSTSHPAHFDALAKPHLEQLGVICICAGVKEAWLLDDPSSMLQLCHDAGLSTPVHFRISTPEQLTSLYEEGQLRRARHVLVNAGPLSIREEQIELELPQTRRGFRRLVQTKPKPLLNLCASRPAVIIQIPEGERLVTCTTVRDGRVVANVTCRAPLPDEENPPLQPLARGDVDEWVVKLISAVPPNRMFTGHVTFTLVSTRIGLVPINCRFGVTLPYLCYTGLQARLLLRPCKHHQQLPTPEKASLILPNGRYWLCNVIGNHLRSPSIFGIFKLLITFATKHETLFSPWDPIPSCVYYGLQLPARSILKLLHGSQKVLLNPSIYNHNHVHFSNDTTLEYDSNEIIQSATDHIHTNNNVTKNFHNHNSILKSHVHTFSPILEDCHASGSTMHERRNGFVNKDVRKNGLNLSSNVQNEHIPNGDLIQL